MTKSGDCTTLTVASRARQAPVAHSARSHHATARQRVMRPLCQFARLLLLQLPPQSPHARLASGVKIDCCHSICDFEIIHMIIINADCFQQRKNNAGPNCACTVTVFLKPSTPGAATCNSVVQNAPCASTETSGTAGPALYALAAHTSVAVVLLVVTLVAATLF
jgi:hypothetical protein